MTNTWRAVSDRHIVNHPQKGGVTVEITKEVTGPLGNRKKPFDMEILYWEDGQKLRSKTIRTSLKHGDKVTLKNVDISSDIIITETVDTSKYDFVSLPECSEWGVLMKNNDILAKEDFITRKMIKDMPLILHQRIGLQEEIAHWAQESLQDLNVVATYNVVHGSPISFVKQDLGYFLTTRDLLASHLDKDFCFKTLKPQLKVKYAIVWKKHSVFSKVSNAFLSKLKQIIEN